MVITMKEIKNEPTTIFEDSFRFEPITENITAKPNIMMGIKVIYNTAIMRILNKPALFPSADDS